MNYIVTRPFLYFTKLSSSSTEISLLLSLIAAIANHLRLIEEQRRRVNALVQLIQDFSIILLEQEYLISSTCQ